jgi:dihydrofolate reductase
MILALIAATGPDGEIGYQNKLPWSCKADMTYFRETTKGEGHGCVMGRKTWESLPPKKLPGRQCIVIASNPIDDERCVTVRSFEEARKAAKALKLKKLFIIGGSSLFNDYYGRCDELHITRIHAEVEHADTWFRPDIKPQRWSLVSSDLSPECTINKWVRR